MILLQDPVCFKTLLALNILSCIFFERHANRSTFYSHLTQCNNTCIQFGGLDNSGRITCNGGVITGVILIRNDCIKMYTIGLIQILFKLLINKVLRSS